MRIAQITDLHLNDFLAQRYNLDTRHQFSTLLETVARGPVDHVVVTGDFGEVDQLGWLLDQLRDSSLPFDVVLGNHDSFDVVRESGLAARESRHSDTYDHAFDKGGYRWVFLDTSLGEVSGTQLTWLQDEVARAAGPLLLFCHHPVLEVHPALDRSLGMTNRKDVERVLGTARDPVAIFCGHYHSASLTRRGNLMQSVCPATIMQIRGEGETILTDSFDYGFQWIDVQPDLIGCQPVLFPGRPVQAGE